MSKGINLLGTQARGPIKANFQRLKLLRLIAVSVLFGISGLSIVLFLLIALSPLPTLQNEEKAALARLAVHHPDMAQLLLINDRLRSSEVILSKRTNYDQTLSAAQAILPPDARVSELTIKPGELSITVVSSSLSSLDQFLNNLMVNSQEKKNFSKIILTKLFLNEENNVFNATITMTTL